MKTLILVAALALPAAGCASARAQVEPEDHPALVVPPVPPRHIEPKPAEPPPIELVTELPTGNAPSSPPRPRPPGSRDKPASGDPKPETKPPETTTDPATTGAPAAQPVPPLRTQGTADAQELARQVRDTVDRANKLLASVNPNGLNEERKANLEYAKSFIRQAEDAIKANNLMSAKSLAERAETIAKLLTGG